MRLFIFLTALASLLLSAGECNKKPSSGQPMKGRLEVAGICMNYTIRLLDGTIDTSMIAANWTDEATNISYTNVFAPGNPCRLPATIKQGDEFYFSIDTSTQEECIICMAYYPTPPKKIFIKVVEK